MEKKRSGIGLNGFILVIVAFMVIILAYRGLNIDYKIEKGNIIITWFKGVTIPIKDITEVRILDSTPKMTKIKGVDLMYIRQGTYSLEGVGRVKVYSPDIRRKMILISTDKITYGITPGNPRQFANIINGR